jgi:predicted permease
VLLGIQVAVCCVVICASIVSVRSLAAALKVPIGFDTNGVTAVSLDLSAARYTPQEGLAFQRRALDAVTALPAVTGAAFTSAVPLTLDRSTATVFPSDVDVSTKPVEALVYTVTPTVFDVLQMRLVTGRAFTENDRFQTEPVAIVNRTFSRRVLLTDDAINMRFRTLAGRIVRVVGMVEDGKYAALVESPQPVMFRPVAQSFGSSMVLLVRASRQDASLGRSIERLMAGLDPRVPLLSQGSLADAIAMAFLPAQAASVGITSFGALAVLLALVGIYGLASYSISARVREIGIRVAIGAQPSQALRFALGRTALLLGLGAVCGMLVSAAMAPLLGAVMFHASSRDPIVLATVGLVMVAIGVGAAWIPARRALSLDPARALRET